MLQGSSYTYIGATERHFRCNTNYEFENILFRLIETPLGIEEMMHTKEQELFKAFPNPGSNMLNIELMDDAQNNKMY